MWWMSTCVVFHVTKWLVGPSISIEQIKCIRNTFLCLTVVYGSCDFEWQKFHSSNFKIWIKCRFRKAVRSQTNCENLLQSADILVWINFIGALHTVILCHGIIGWLKKWQFLSRYFSTTSFNFFKLLFFTWIHFSSICVKLQNSYIDSKPFLLHKFLYEVRHDVRIIWMWGKPLGTTRWRRNALLFPWHLFCDGLLLVLIMLRCGDNRNWLLIIKKFIEFFC